MRPPDAVTGCGNPIRQPDPARFRETQREVRGLPLSRPASARRVAPIFSPFEDQAMMKSSWMFVFVMAAVAPGAAGCADVDAGDPAQLAEQTAEITTAEELNAIPVPSTEVARVRVFFGEHVYRVSDEPDPNGTQVAPAVTVLEISRPDPTGQLRILAGDMSPLEMFLATTAATVPVPRVLISTEPSQLIRDRAAGRAIVAALAAPVDGLPAAILTSATTPLASASQYCTGGTSASWLANICSLSNWDVDVCHNGTWTQVSDEVGSGNKKRNSRGYTMGCGTGSRARHYYKLGGLWYKPMDDSFPAGEIWRTTHHGHWALQRAVTHSRTGSSGFVRASSHFNVPF
jgi:hypothetical protein